MISSSDKPRMFATTAVDATLTNNHLQYAITWFALAVLLVVMSGLLIRQTIRKDE